MKRDMDFVRQVLFALEGGPSKTTKIADLDPGGDLDRISYHLALMQDAGLIEQEQLHYWDPHMSDLQRQSAQQAHHVAVRKGEAWAIRLTWQGHEFIDVIS